MESNPSGALWEPGQDTCLKVLPPEGRLVLYLVSLDLGVKEEYQFLGSAFLPCCLHWVLKRIAPFLTHVRLINLIRAIYDRVSAARGSCLHTYPLPWALPFDN